jgi:hypothetical protein
MPKSADQHDATAQYGHYRYTVGCEHTIVEAEAAIGEAHRHAQDRRVGVARQHPDACIVDVQTRCNTAASRRLLASKISSDVVKTS